MLTEYRRVFQAVRKCQREITGADLHLLTPFAGLYVRFVHNCGRAQDYRPTDFRIQMDLRNPLICRHCKGRIDDRCRSTLK